MNTSRQHGFTLWELLMALLVAGILLGIGVPNIMELQRNGVMTGAANDVITAVMTARTEAVKRQVPTTWCLTDDPLAATPTCVPGLVTDSVSNVGGLTVTGFVVWVDENDNGVLTDATDGNLIIDAGETILSRGTAPGNPVRVSANCGHVSYSQSGFRRQVAGTGCPGADAARMVVFCDDRGRRVASGSLSSARVVRVDRLGRAQVQSDEVAVSNVITTLPVGGVNLTCPP
jgi:type IV fimbrial biogenesis protein FimT